jgi:hypothetical protein
VEGAEVVITAVEAEVDIMLLELAHSVDQV